MINIDYKNSNNYTICSMTKQKHINIWTKTDIARYYGVDIRTVITWVVRYRQSAIPFPEPVYTIGNSRKYSVQQVKQWIANPLKDL